jgi:FkbM family methyltransferase
VPSHYFSRRIANRLLKHRGLSIQNVPSDADPRGSLLLDAGIRSVLDVGANTGQYGLSIRQAGFRGPILSFEPQSAAFSQLSLVAAKDPQWKAFRCALGNETGEVELNIAGNSQSSSVLPMLELHAANAPSSVYVATETVPLRRVDDVVSEERVAGPLHLKIDVQGFEMAVLGGSTESLSNVNSMELEMSFAPLYDGQPAFDDLLDWVREQGFSFYDVVPGFRATNGRLLQIDGLFLRGGDHRG